MFFDEEIRYLIITNKLDKFILRVMVFIFFIYDITSPADNWVPLQSPIILCEMQQPQEQILNTDSWMVGNC